MVNVSILIRLVMTVTSCECRVRAVAQAISRRPLPAEAWVQFQASPCGICGGQSGIGTGFLSSVSGFPRSISPPMRHTQSVIYH